MSKRHLLQQQFGKRKKAKLNVSVSDHNFPQSQNAETSKDMDIWGDGVDDEMLLLASQAAQDAISSQNISELRNYSICMDPPSTSTQIQQPMPSTSKGGFQFKVPSSNIVLATLTSKLNDKSERISSPLPGISKLCLSNNINISDDFIFNNKICKGQDSEHIYCQLLQLKEENENLKSENGKLLEKCVTNVLKIINEKLKFHKNGKFMKEIAIMTNVVIYAVVKRENSNTIFSKATEGPYIFVQNSQ